MVIDIGCGEWFGLDEQWRKSCGTPGYWAPEIAKRI